MKAESKIRAPLSALAVALVMTVVSGSAFAQPSNAEAESHFKRGVSLYQESDFKAALVEFKRAYEISHNWRLLFNVAQAEYQAHDYAAALADFETYLREGSDKVPRARKTEVDQEIAKLRARVGRVTVKASVEGAVVTIDDELVGSAPITRNVAVGEHRVGVKRDGYAAWTRSVAVASGDGLVVEAVLEPAAGGNAVPPPPPPSPEPAHFPWEPWAVTGAFTVAAITTGILSLNAASDLSSAKGRFAVTDSELHDASKQVKTLGLVTDLLFIGALASAGVSLYFTLKAPSAESRASVRVSPRVSAEGGGLAASGSF